MTTESRVKVEQQKKKKKANGIQLQRYNVTQRNGPVKYDLFSGERGYLINVKRLLMLCAYRNLNIFYCLIYIV